MPFQLGFLGAGNMAEAIARTAITANILPPSAMIAVDPSPDRRALFASLGIAAADSHAQVITQSAQILLAVKPQAFPTLTAELAKHLRSQHVLISIMAGLTTQKIAAAIAAAAPASTSVGGASGGFGGRIVRVMPNTPMLAGLGMAGIALGLQAQPGDDDLAFTIFSAGQSKAIRVNESQLDAITAVSGSGPAYVFYLAEAMIRAADGLGLKAHADLLVRQTILGAAHLLSQSPDAAADLRRKVTSPGGTTEAAIRHLDGNKTTEVIVNAIKAADKRSRELAG
ncbi:MAG: pyrroline-5-carboxylate reductase [Phycisphaeraceae bacterium]|nr:pyrroline-5-carboxylate reductase [Phycisphaeraceae bacterium]